LRHEGYDGRIILIGEEPWLPYERPPLSKEYLWLSGNAPENFYLQDECWYDENKIERRLDTRATAVDLQSGGVRLEDGAFVAADRILLATGGSVKRLSIEGGDASNVHYLRNKDDADALSVHLRPGSRILVVGMGVIGCEVAASAKKMGCEVIAVEPAPVPMIRTLGQRFGAWLAGVHREHGIDLRLETGVSSFHKADNRVSAAVLSSGEIIACDAVVIGIGINPRVELAQEAGIDVSNGIITNSYGQTSNPNVFAAGDVAFSPGFFQEMVRLETYQNAGDQAANACLAMLGKEPAGVKPPWFWSDQFDLNLQVAGKIEDGLDIVVRGNVEDNKFTAFFLQGSTLVGILTVNDAPNMGVGRRLVAARKEVDSKILAENNIPLREFLKA
jgi:3-phenylpropionate/trans-cinnamate dioxygenase ferredoxin reductase subunit